MVTAGHEKRRHAVVGGAAEPFGAEIVARLTADGYDVTSVDRDFAARMPERVDVLVLNAPVEPEGLRFADVSDADFLRAVERQLYAPVAAAQAAVPRMEQGGAIVHVGSRAHLGAWGGVHQMAAGAAMVGMSRSMAMELSERDIRVNLLAPDFVGESWDTPAAREMIAEAVAWLAGPESRLVSGETLLVDQGRCLRMTQSARR